MRVLVTRPAAEAAATVARLTRLGHQAIAAPLLSIVPTGAKLPLGPFTAIVATSANAVAALTEAPPPGLADVSFYAAGARTADAARAGGFRNIREPRADAKSLLAELIAGLPAEAEILYLAGRDRKATLESGLRGRGIVVKVIETYVALAADTLPPAIIDALHGRTLDAVFHYSPRSAAIFCRLIDKAGLAQAAAALAHYCISSEAAGPLSSLCPSCIIVAEKPDERSLFATLRSR
jgi:uroporphyrinogen-III synthase